MRGLAVSGLALTKLAWRDLCAFPVKALLIILALSLSIAAIHGVRSAQRAAQSVLEGDLRRWLGADLAASTGEPFDTAIFAALDGLRAQGIDWTSVTWSGVMARSSQTPDAALIVVKVVDPEVYPFYPGLTLDPSQPLADVLRTPDVVAVSPELLERLQVRSGDTISIAGHPFRITAVVLTEADRFNGFAGVAMRAIVSRAGYQQSRIALSGNAAKHAVLLRLPPGASPDLLATARIRLQQILPEAAVSDYRESNRQAVATVRMTIAFLGVTALLVFTVGVTGLAAGVRRHVLQQTPFIAGLKITGATTAQITAIFLLQIGMLLAAALLLGVPLGLLARDVALSMAGALVGSAAAPALDVLETLVAAVIALLLVLPRPLLLIRQVRPLAILRGAAHPENTGSLRKWGAVAFAVACVVLGAIAARTVTSWVSAGFLIAALAVCLGLAVLLASAAVGLLDRCARSIRTPAIRQGLRNLASPSLGAHTLIVSMALGLTILMATFAAQRVIARALIDSLPFDDANLFVAGFESQHSDEIRAFLAAQAGVAAPVSLVTQTRLRLARVDGAPVEQLQRLRKPEAAPETWRDIGCLPDSQSQAGSLPLRVTVADDVAALLGATAGSLLEFATRGRTISATVAGVRKMTRAEKLWYTFTLDCAALHPQPGLFHLAAVRFDPAHLQSARQAVATRFPMVAVLTAEDVAAAIVQVSRDALALTRIVASYAMLASLAVLAAAVAASRRARLRELAILSALGASRNTLLRIYTVELAAIGIIAALIAGVLSLGFLSVVLSAILQRAEFAFHWQPVAAAAIVSTLLTVAAGWLPLYPSLRRKPMESLRQE